MIKYNHDLTICIPMRDNLPTIKLVLHALCFQDCYPEIVILDNGSRDGCCEAVETIIKNRYFPDLELRLMKFGEHVGEKRKNIERVRYELSQGANTKYLMFIDADVLIPPYIILGMLNTMEKNEKIGMLGLKYDVLANHVKMGATMMRTELAKKIKWRFDDEGCDCLHAKLQIENMGYKVKHFPSTARHLLAF